MSGAGMSGGGGVRRRSAAFGAAVLAALAAILPAPRAASGEPAKFTVVNGAEIRESLTGRPGDAERGRAIAADRALGNCVACHAMPVGEPFQGDVGPDLRGVASRLSEAEIRLRVVDAKMVNPGTAMPPYHRVERLHGMRKDLVGKPILSAGQVEDVVAFLMTLKD
jgi:sulfur-oxidizing protein SoxX